MNLTLRKSDAVQKLIQEELSSTNIETTVAITRFNSPDQVVSEARAKFETALDKKTALSNAYYALRKETAVKNCQAGVCDILADVALLDKQIGMLKPLAATKEFRPGTGNINAQQEDLRGEKTEKYSRRESIAISVLDEQDAQQFTTQIAELRRRRQNLSDKLLELNVQNTIEVGADVEHTLREYNII